MNKNELKQITNEIATDIYNDVVHYDLLGNKLICIKQHMSPLVRTIKELQKENEQLAEQLKGDGALTLTEQYAHSLDYIKGLQKEIEKLKARDEKMTSLYIIFRDKYQWALGRIEKLRKNR